MASTGWFIGMMLALALLLLVLVLVCIIKRNRGGKYAVHEREATHGRKDFNEDAGFHEYSQPYETKLTNLIGIQSLNRDPSPFRLNTFRVGSSRAPSKASLSSGAKMPPESEDNDSMAEYGEGEAGKRCEFNPFYVFFYNVLMFTLSLHCTQSGLVRLLDSKGWSQVKLKRVVGVIHVYWIVSILFSARPVKDLFLIFVTFFHR